MKVPVPRLVLAGALAGGIGLALPGLALAQSLSTPAATVASVVDLDDSHSTVPVTAPLKTQVSAVPTGGAAAGGGEPTGGGTDAVLLIGVGIAAVAGSIGLFAAAQVAGRRD